MAEALGFCVYGPPGAGKTSLCGTLPGRGLVIDVPQIEGGTLVLANHADRIDVVPVKAWSELKELYFYLLNQPHEYKWVAVDSISAMSQLAMGQVVKDRTLGGDAHQLTQAEWGKIGSLVGELVLNFRRLPTHTYWIAQEREHGAAGGHYTRIGPEVTPFALQKLIPSMMFMARLTVEPSDEGGWERHLRIGPAAGYITKYRAVPGQNMPAVVRNPNLGQIIGYLRGVANVQRPEEVTETAFILGS